MEKEVIDVTEDVIEVDQAETKPAKTFKILGREVKITKAEKPAKEPKAKKHIGKKVLIGIGAAVGTGVVLAKVIANAASAKKIDDEFQTESQMLDQPDDIVGYVDTEIVTDPSEEKIEEE